jgi:hypothetical protein
LERRRGLPDYGRRTGTARSGAAAAPQAGRAALATGTTHGRIEQNPPAATKHMEPWALGACSVRGRTGCAGLLFRARYCRSCWLSAAFGATGEPECARARTGPADPIDASHHPAPSNTSPTTATTIPALGQRIATSIRSRARCAQPGTGPRPPNFASGVRHIALQEHRSAKQAPYAAAPNNETASSATSVGVRPTRTPRASSASALAFAVPWEPETIAPAWPIVLPGGAVNPAM